MQAIFQGLLQSGEQQVENQMEKCFSIKEDTSFGRLNYYQEYQRQGQQDPVQLGVGPHSDAGMLTVLYQQGGICSLQVEKNNKFYNVPPKKSKILMFSLCFYV
jgi:isopenicillin N synthase-like dioxygenase